MAGLVSPDRQLLELAAGARIDGHDRVRAHVRVDPDYDHRRSLPVVISRITGGQHNVKTAQVRLLSSHASDPPTRRAT